MGSKSSEIFLLLAILSLRANSTQWPTLETTSRVLLALKDYFQADCLAFISAGSLNNHVLTTELSRLVANSSVATALLDVSTLANAQRKIRHCMRPLNLLMCDSERLQIELEQITRNITLTGPIWLLFANPAQKINQTFQKVYVPFDCEFLVATETTENKIILYEVYHVAKSWAMQVEKFGTWSVAKGLSATPGGLYTRRDSLHGLTLRATNVHDPPLSIVSVENGTMHLSGFCGNIWRLLEQRMNFTTIHGLPPVGGNRWEEMMFQLIRGEADVTATYITHTLPRDLVIDFTMPLRKIPLRIFIAESSGKDVEWSDFLTPFSKSLWLAFFGSTLTAATLLAIFYRIVRDTQYSTEDYYPLKDSIFLVFGSIFCQQGHARTPETAGLRIVHLVTLLIGIIAINSYAGVLISNLTVVIPTIPFKTMEEIYATNNYQFGMINKSLTHLQLMNATGGILKQMFTRYVKTQPENAPVTYLEGFNRVCGTRFAFVALSEALTLLRDQVNCTVIYIPQYFTSFSASIAFPKGSPYRGLFNHNLLRLLTGGILRTLHKAALNERPPSFSDEIKSINLETVAPILSIVALGMLIASVILVGEKVLPPQPPPPSPTASSRKSGRGRRRRLVQVSPLQGDFWS